MRPLHNGGVGPGRPAAPCAGRLRRARLPGREGAVALLCTEAAGSALAFLCLAPLGVLSCRLLTRRKVVAELLFTVWAVK